MKVIKTLLNAWTTSSRMGGAHYIYPCLFGCSDSRDRLGHYLIRSMMFSFCNFMHRDLSIHPTDRWGFNSPSRGDIIHMCCVFSAYHATAAHVKQDHDTHGTADQTQKLLIKSQRKTWSIFAGAYEAEARDFGLSCPRYTLAATIQWHLAYEGPKLNHEIVDLSQDPLILCPVSTELSLAPVQSPAPSAPT